MNKKIRKILLVFTFSIISLFSALIPNSIARVYASVGTDAIVYTNVLDDLQKDSNFNVDDYPVNMTDYSLQVIQVAESEDKELFIYVYQPCSPNEDLKATTINISTTIGENLSYKNYSLRLLNSSGCFYKYRVRNFAVNNDNVRYYDISSIFRKWNANYDSDSGNDNEITEVAFAVAHRFTAKTMSNGNIEYANNGTDVVYITDKWCGFCHYTGGFELFGWADACDSWFVAFDTDRQIDRLLEADVYYVEQTWFYGLNAYVYGFDTMTGTPFYTYLPFDYLMPEEINEENINNYSKIAHLNYTQRGEFQGAGWWASKYEWDRISTTQDFIANENRENIYELGIINVKQQTQMTGESLQKLQGKQWVLRFVETPFIEEGTTMSHSTQQSIISNVSILRLKFETDGVVYNLGCIDNKQSADLIADNETTYSIELADWFKIFLGLLLILLLVVLYPILPIILKVIWVVIKTIIKVVWFIVTLPFRLIKIVISKRSE